MIKKTYLLAVFMLASLAMNALQAQPKIEFVETTHNFGTISETGGLATHVFEFKNVGDAPLVIQRVTASCGCTTPKWTKEPVPVGKGGTINVSYNPRGRPGSFNKTITVFSNASNEVVRMSIRGKVERKTIVKNTHPVKLDVLGLTSKKVNLNTVNKGNKANATIGVVNNSASDVSLSLGGMDYGFNAEVTPAILKPKQKGTINISFDSDKTNEWGEIINDVFLRINGVKKDDVADKLSFHVNVVEDFSKMSIDQKRKAPIVEIKSSTLKFGKIRQGKKVRGKIQIKNVGEKNLEIRKITNTNSNFIIQPGRLTIKSGKKEKLRIDIDTQHLQKGDYKKTFRVLTNDPVTTTIVYTVIFSVV